MIKVAAKTFMAWWNEGKVHALTTVPLQFASVFVTVALTWLTTSKKKREEFYSVRRPICEVCPLFNHEDQTCGTIGSFARSNDHLIKIGCWCYLPVAARIPSKKCWKSEHGLIGGWP